MTAINEDKQPKTVKMRQHLKKEDLKRLLLGFSPPIDATISELIVGPLLN